jgi:hypothetical protein
MSGLSRSPRVVKGGLVFVDPTSGAIQRIVTLQYNPDSISRTLQVQGAGAGAERSEALRLKGPPVETIKLDAELDATDQLEFPEGNRAAVEAGLHPQLAALEAAAYPSVAELTANDASASVGTIEVIPIEAPLTLFVWSAHRILPVRLTDLNIVEEAFDPALNPIRAKVSFGMRVLSVDDLGFRHRGSSVYLASLLAREKLVGQAPPAGLSNLGIGGVP